MIVLEEDLRPNWVTLAAGCGAIALVSAALLPWPVAVASIALLADAAKFGKFVKVYSVGRTIRCGTSDDLRKQLRSPQFLLTELLQDATGAALDEADFELRKLFGTREGQRKLRSALSKIVAFLAPHAFNAWDTYARKGVMVQTCSLKIRTYTEYLTQINQLLGGELGECIREVCISNYPTPYSEEQGRFHRRVLDRYLMDLGGRPRR
jgi:hypothetical protein